MCIPAHDAAFLGQQRRPQSGLLAAPQRQARFPLTCGIAPLASTILLSPQTSAYLKPYFTNPRVTTDPQPRRRSNTKNVVLPAEAEKAVEAIHATE